jgi:hypothetical protein
MIPSCQKRVEGKEKVNSPPPRKRTNPRVAISVSVDWSGSRTETRQIKISSRVKIYSKYKLINTYSVNKILKEY